ncbi:MAG: polysaccharide biosynthesis tyrosine autokinase [Gammaproteobacteria bacterium]|nr:polysaccharide biosynthesis tyrosine autokinase [Gammaproteobacteria bacterium]
MNTTINRARNNANEDEIDFSSLLHQFLDHKKLIFITTSICLAMGIFHASRQVPLYKSDVLVQIEDSHNGAGSFLGGIQTQLNIGTSHNNSTFIEIALIQSRFILEPVSRKLGLDLSIQPKQSLFKRLFSPIKGSAQVGNFVIPQNKFDQPFKLNYDRKNHIRLYDTQNKICLEGEIGKPLSDKAGLIKLKIDNIDAPIGTEFQLTKSSSSLQIANAIASRLKIEDLGKKLGNTGILSISLTDTDPNRAIRILNAIALETKTKDAEKKSLEASKTLEFLDHELPIVKDSLEKAELALNEYRAKSGKIDIKTQATALLGRLEDLDKQLSTLRIEEIDISQRYTPAHPAFQALKNQIKAIKQDRDELEKTLKTLPLSDQIAVNLMRDVEVKNSLYTQLLNEIQRLQVIKAGMISDVNILSPATTPDAPLSGQNNIIYLVSLILGLMISGALIFGRKLLFPRIQDPLWIEKQFNIANLAIIPYSQEQYQNSHSLTGSSKTKHLALLAQTNPRNLSIESLRSLRTSLQVHLSCSRNNIISILGLSPGVGKTFVSSNLAYLLATAGKRVLLIDADLRRGTLHRYFNIPSTPGLAEAIQNTAILSDVIKETSHTNLSILPCGHHPDDPAELLSGGRFKEIIETLSQQFDIVLLDTAPLLFVTDAALISAISSVNYLVLGSGAHQPTDIEIAMKRLGGAGVTVIGSIFNFHNASSNTNSYYQKYYSYYAYQPN